MGVDFDLTHERLSVAADAVRAGAFFAVTNRDPVFPVPGRLMAGAGAMVAALVEASGRQPDLVIGKPEPGLLREAAAVAGVPVEEAVVIGDGLRTDILAAHRVGRAQRPRAHRREHRGDGGRAACRRTAHLSSPPVPTSWSHPRRLAA